VEEFDELQLIAKGVCEKQVNIAKIVSEIESVEFKEAIISPSKFVNYKFAKDGTAYKVDSIDLRLPKPEKGRIVMNQEITQIYLTAKFSAVFNEHYSPKHFLINVLLPKFEHEHFAAGVIKQDYHMNNYLETRVLKEEEIVIKRKYTLPKIKQFIAVFFSVQAIGDTTIEIYDS